MTENKTLENLEEESLDKTMTGEKFGAIRGTSFFVPIIPHTGDETGKKVQKNHEICHDNLLKNN